MGQFEYVMVLVSIIVGLGIAHTLLGIGGIIDRLSRKGDGLELSLAHASWLGYAAHVPGGHYRYVDGQHSGPQCHGRIIF